MEPTSLGALLLLALGVPTGNVVHESLLVPPSARTTITRAEPVPVRQTNRRLVRTISITHIEITEEEQSTGCKTNCSSPTSSVHSKL